MVKGHRAEDQRDFVNKNSHNIRKSICRVISSMTELNMSETSLLGSSKKFYGRSYGTTQRSVQETYIKHPVTPDDTLQGISLKYGVTVR